MSEMDFCFLVFSPSFGPARRQLGYSGKNTILDARRICHLAAASFGAVCIASQSFVCEVLSSSWGSGEDHSK